MSGTFSTQSDVARLSKVSRSTVAAILRSHPRNNSFSPETRQRVMEAARRLNYRPNSAARSLRSGRTHAVALTVPNFSAVRGPIQIANLQGIGEQAQKLGYALTLSGYEERSDLRSTFRKLLREGRFDGVLFYGDQQSDMDDERERIFSGLEIPFVVLEKTTPGSCCINFDNLHGAGEATGHLIRLGRRRIGFIGHDQRGIPYRQRYEGYQAACRAAGVEIDPALSEPLRPGGFAEAGRRGVRRLIEQGIDFDALVCVCDETAMAVMQTLAEHGRRVPETVAVVGYDDHPLAALATPALTTVRQDGIEMGRRAMEMLHRQIETGNRTPVHEVIRPALVVRRSCGAAGSTF